MCEGGLLKAGGERSEDKLEVCVKCVGLHFFPFLVFLFGFSFLHNYFSVRAVQCNNVE